MAAWPAVRAAVFTTAENALPKVPVIQGRDISQSPDDVVVMIGIQNVQDIEEEGGFASAGSFQQVMQTFGGNREEVGTVNGLVLARNGDADQEAAFTAADDSLAALEAAVRSDPTLGLTGFDYVVAEMQTGDVSESQNDDGAVTALSFVIAYQIRI